MHQAENLDAVSYHIMTKTIAGFLIGASSKTHNAASECWVTRLS